MENDIEKLHAIVEKVRRSEVDRNLIQAGASFDELGLDSLALAELTVRIEREFGVDVFSDGIISSIGEVLERIGTSK